MNDVENCLTKGIKNFISQKTRGFFDRNPIPMDFLQKVPLEWEDGNSSQIGLEMIKKIKVVNDTAERGVKLLNPRGDAGKISNNIYIYNNIFFLLLLH